MTVWLVGAGPGDPGLITARGLELIRRCDALVYDRLVAPELVDEAPVGARLITREGMQQEQINDLLVQLGREGLEVVRLKGGDPYVYGRGGEEAMALAEAGLAFDVVPGVSALASAPAAAGIPLTHRGVADRVRFFTGHSADESVEGETLVYFMGLQNLHRVVEDLLAEGLDPATPAAVISRGTRPDQQVVVAELAELADAAEGLPGPALIVVGDVVRVREQILGGSLLETLGL
jgi:uroporphyrin-III C-methyltransferase